METNLRVWFPQRVALNSAKIRLVCLPYAGGGSAIFNNWQRLLGDRIEVCAVQLPGRASRSREMPYRTLEPLAAELAKVLSGLCDLPAALFGHSLGALIAFAVARELEKTSRVQLVRLLVSGRRAPHCPRRDEPVTGLSDEQFIDRLRLINGTPEAILSDQDFMNAALPMLRADFELNDRYTFIQGKLRVPLSVFGSTQDREINADDLAAWRDITEAACNVLMFPGDHFFIHAYEPLLLGAVAEELATGPGSN